MRFGRDAPELVPPEVVPPGFALLLAPGIPDEGARVSVPPRIRREVRSPVLGTAKGDELRGTPAAMPDDAGACIRGRVSPCAERCGAACAGDPDEDAAAGGGP